MNFSTLFLQIIDQMDGERKRNAVYHLLRGKRSGQTIQDVSYYRLHPYFSIFPQLSLETYEQWIEPLFHKGWVVENEEGYVSIDRTRIPQLEKVSTHFNGWLYRGREMLFFERLALIVQTLSYQAYNERTFQPVTNDERIQQFVRSYYKREQLHREERRTLFYEALKQSLRKQPLGDRFAHLLVARLTGFRSAGQTWNQLAEREQLSIGDVRLLFVEGLHGWIPYVEQSPILAPLVEGVKEELVLTESAYRTNEWWRRGYSIEQLAKKRKLKRSTIEDHLVEIALVDPQFPLEQFMSRDRMERIRACIQKERTYRLRPIKRCVEEASYFEIRLVLAQGSGSNWNNY